MSADQCIVDGNPCAPGQSYCLDDCRDWDLQFALDLNGDEAELPLVTPDTPAWQPADQLLYEVPTDHKHGVPRHQPVVVGMDYGSSILDALEFDVIDLNLLRADFLSRNYNAWLSSRN